MKNLFKALLLVVAFATVSFISSEKETITVVIDAGHGGHDFGGKHDDLLEKDLANAISKKIEALNSDKNIKLLFTRDDDKFVELAERTNYINSVKPDLVLSLHVNNNKNITTNDFLFSISVEHFTCLVQFRIRLLYRVCLQGRQEYMLTP